MPTASCSGATWPTRPATCRARTSSSTDSSHQRRHGPTPEVEDRLEVAADEQPVGELTERAEADRVADDVAHERPAVAVGRERVRVVPERVGAAHLDVDEAVRRLPVGD